MLELEKAEQPYHLLIAGDGIARDHLQRAAAATIPGKVSFVGHISDREELARLYASCDLFLHPNPEEPFGIAPLEAMASGLCLVAPNRGGLTAYANDDNAYLAEPTAEAFTQAITVACASDDLRRRKVQAARATAESLAWTTVTDSFLQLYDSLHRLGTDRPGMKAASPAFTSSAAQPAEASRLRLASSLARAGFLAYVSAHRFLGLTSLRKGRHPTELKGMQTS